MIISQILLLGEKNSYNPVIASVFKTYLMNQNTNLGRPQFLFHIGGLLS